MKCIPLQMNSLAEGYFPVYCIPMIRPAFQSNESLRRLRSIIGYSQERFAALVGVSTVLIKMVETGRRELSHNLAHRIFMATGATLERMDFSGRKPCYVPFTDGTIRGPVPYMEDGNFVGWSWKKDYTAEDFEAYKAFTKNQAGSVPVVLAELVPMVEALLKASTTKRPTGRLPAVRAALLEALAMVDHQFKLGTIKSPA